MRTSSSVGEMSWRLHILTVFLRKIGIDAAEYVSFNDRMLYSYRMHKEVWNYAKR